MVDFKTLEKRYLTDPYFYHFVNVLVNEMRNLKTTPSEIREIVMFAQYKFELENLQPICRRSDET